MLSLFDQFASNPGVIAKLMVRAVNDVKSKTRYHAGMGASLSLTGRRWLSDRQFDRMMTSAVNGAAKLSKVTRRKDRRAGSRHYQHGNSTNETN